MIQNYTLYNQPLEQLRTTKALINTINAHSFNVSQTDPKFKEALINSDALLPDGVGVVWALKVLTGQKVKKIAGADLFAYEMERLNTFGGKCFFLGSTVATLRKIRKNAMADYPNVQIFHYSPPYKPEFTDKENALMIDAINAVEPDVLFVGMTAPKQEKWAYAHFHKLKAKHICCIGAVFDFYAGTIKRAPQWMINAGLEWLYRLLKEPRRMWKRYLVGNIKFIVHVLLEKMEKKTEYELQVTH